MHRTVTVSVFLSPMCTRVLGGNPTFLDLFLVGFVMGILPKIPTPFIQSTPEESL